MVYAAVLGHGVVGSGVLELFYKNHDNIVSKAGDDMEIKYILDRRDFEGLPYSDKFVKDYEIIINDPDIRIIVEVMGGLDPAYDYVRRALEAGKNVVTSNKELVAAYGAELLAIAHRTNTNFLFEASVGGGIPIIRPISQCLAANEVIEIAGILNGTTNFILTKMATERMDFADALALAQKLGYAERDPSADINGLDSCRKICILASLAFGRHVYPKDVHTEGITDIKLKDIRYAAAWGHVIKLIGRVRKLPDGRISAMVCPALISCDSQLANVGDVFNGIMVRGDAIGDVVFYGRGAGKMPTASAVVADMIDVVKHLKARKYLFWLPAKDGYVCDYREAPCVTSVRAGVRSRDEALRSANGLFGKVYEVTESEMPSDELTFVTPSLPEGEISRALDSFESLGYPILSKIRVLDY